MSAWRKLALTAAIRGQCSGLVLSGLLGCGVTDPSFPDGQVQRFAPKPIFALWWQLVETCSGLRGDFSRVQFYKSLGQLVIDGKSVAGYWSPEGNRIALADIAATDGRVVRHEMLHALLQSGDHALSYFAGRCDGVVSFDAPEGYGVTNGEADTVTGPAVLHVTVTPIAADTLTFSRYQGHYLFRISAVNRATRPVWVRVPPDQRLGGYFLEVGALPAATSTSASRVYFAAGQRREVLLDAQAANPGQYQVQGLYLGSLSPWKTFTIR